MKGNGYIYLVSCSRLLLESIKPASNCPDLQYIHFSPLARWSIDWKLIIKLALKLLIPCQFRHDSEKVLEMILPARESLIMKRKTESCRERVNCGLVHLLEVKQTRLNTSLALWSRSGKWFDFPLTPPPALPKKKMLRQAAGTEPLQCCNINKCIPKISRTSMANITG